MLEHRGTPAGRIGRRGKVGAIPIGLSVRGEEHGQRPAAMFPHHAEGGLVYGIYVGPLFAVDLDVDEQLVHDRGGAAAPKLSRAITWHQWQAADPTEKSIDLSAASAE